MQGVTSKWKCGTQNVTIGVSENKNYDDRSAVLRLMVGDSTKTFIVNQKQLDALTLTADKFEVPQEGGKVDVEVKSNIDFNYVIPAEFQSWIHASSSRGTRALTSHHLSFTIDASEEYVKREGQIVIKSTNKEEVISIYQGGGGLLTLTSNEISISSEGGTAEIVVNSNFDFDIEMPNVDWLKQADVAKTRAMSSHVIKFEVAENKGYDDRTASVRIYDKNSDLSETVKITQSQVNAILVDGEKKYVFYEEGGTFTVSLNSNVKYEVLNHADYFVKESSSQAQTRALSTSSHTFVVDKLPGNFSRTGVITFKNEETNTSESITIWQEPSLNLPYSVEMPEGNTHKLIYTNNLEDKRVTFTSSNPNVVTVSEDGTVTAVARGNATITVTSADGKHSNTCEVTVKNIVDYLNFYCSSASVVILNGIITYGSQLEWTLINNSNSDITLKRVQLVYGETEHEGIEYGFTNDPIIPAGQSYSYKTTIEAIPGYHTPLTCRFKIEHKDKMYTIEAVYKD